MIALKLNFLIACKPLLLPILAIILLSNAMTKAARPESRNFGTDLNGKSVRLAISGIHVVVLIFAATDCPLSKRSVPEIARLQREFNQGVAFWWVYPNPSDKADAVRKLEKDFSIAAPALIDSRQDLVRMAHISVTPEVAVFAVENGELREQYHGRIDDR